MDGPKDKHGTAVTMCDRKAAMMVIAASNKIQCGGLLYGSRFEPA